MDNNPQLRAPIHVIANQKGGVGKTYLVNVLAQYFSFIKHQKVLVIDTDMQCNLTSQLVGMEASPHSVGGFLPPKDPNFNPESGCSERPTIADIFNNRPIKPLASWLTEDICKGGFVHVLCGHPKELEEINLKNNIHNVLREFLHSEQLQSAYDVILIDTGPHRSPILRSVVRASTSLTIPFNPEENDLQGIAAMWQMYKEENYARQGKAKALKLTGIFPNKCKKTKVHQGRLELLQQDKATIIFPEDCWLGNYTAIPARDIKGAVTRSLFEMKSSKAAQTTLKACQYIYSQIQLTTTKEVEPA